MWAREAEFDTLMVAQSIRTGVPVWVIKATIAKESGFDPGAFRDEPKLKDASRGLGQLLLSTAIWLGYRGEAGDDQAHTGGLYDPAESIRWTAEYLKRQRRRYPDAPWDEIYAAYNAGSIRYAADEAGKILEPRRLINEANLAGWRRAADHFRPGWRAEPIPARPFRRRGSAGA
jgi:soluble lytic murein transglycosylase-like protein